VPANPCSSRPSVASRTEASSKAVQASRFCPSTRYASPRFHEGPQLLQLRLKRRLLQRFLGGLNPPDGFLPLAAGARYECTAKQAIGPVEHELRFGGKLSRPLLNERLRAREFRPTGKDTTQSAGSSCTCRGIAQASLGIRSPTESRIASRLRIDAQSRFAHRSSNTSSLLAYRYSTVGRNHGDCASKQIPKPMVWLDAKS
jgi:hypothetical protein